MTATILFEVAKADDVLMVPNAALRFNPQAAAEAAQVDWRRPGRGQPIQPRVFRLEGAQPVEVAVELGLNDGSFTEVKAEGLKEGDALVVEQVLNAKARLPAATQRMPRM